MKLWRYIQGDRKGKEAHRIEKEAMQDPFLADALEGFDQVKGKHTESIQMLRKQIILQSTKKRINPLRVWSIAASLLIAIGAGTYFLIKDVELPAVPSSDKYVDVIQEELIIPAGKESIITDSTSKTPSETLAVAQAPQTPQVHSKQKETQDVISVVSEDIIITEEDSSKKESFTYASSGNAVAVVEEQDITIENIQKKKKISKETQAIEKVTRSKVPFAKIQEVAKIKGKITDNQGEPIVGASVWVSGTSRATLTDLDGHFELTSNNGEKVEVQYIGYEPVTLPADTGKTMLIAMHESQAALDEVVVVGYGNQKRRNVSPPKPINGERAYRKYLKEKLVPPTDECKESKGEVVLTLQVDDYGRPCNVHVLKSLCPSADQEALRLINEGPDWQTGTGIATVKVKF